MTNCLRTVDKPASDMGESGMATGEPTGEDRMTAQAAIGFGGLSEDYLSTAELEQVEAIAAALAAEREKARAPFLALIDKYQAEAFDDHHAGFTTAMDLVSEIRQAAEADR